MRNLMRSHNLISLAGAMQKIQKDATPVESETSSLPLRTFAKLLDSILVARYKADGKQFRFERDAVPTLQMATEEVFIQFFEMTY